MSPLEVFAAAVTVVSIYLATRENVWYYPTGIVSVLLYAWIYYRDYRMYAESGLQFVWLVLMIYGWYEWLHGGADRTELPVSKTPAVSWIAVVAGGVMLTAAIIWIQVRFTDNPNPIPDSSIAGWSIVAQWMTARKYLESWLAWIAVNLVAVPFYIYRTAYPTAVVYAILLILAVEGYRKWRRSLVSA